MTIDSRHFDQREDLVISTTKGRTWSSRRPKGGLGHLDDQREERSLHIPPRTSFELTIVSRHFDDEVRRGEISNQAIRFLSRSSFEMTVNSRRQIPVISTKRRTRSSRRLKGGEISSYSPLYLLRINLRSCHFERSLRREKSH
ncbi:hypothetical protein LV83_03640 [Algoriphagus yeomjeoni]|uniref:Uncharacterized protein n=1 Tax=Algoriphagus yeomjeoni TaxID=291403 RepID=A0A327P000_9BACT|nr:hypothetical protein LV83_03640 [Algoriphagus yeomjeoni]